MRTFFAGFVPSFFVSRFSSNMATLTTSTWISRLQALTEAYEDRFERLSPEHLNAKPDPNRWSIGQCIDHIITTNRQYFPIFDQIIQGRYRPSFYQRMPVLPGLFGRMILRSVQPDTLRKISTVPVFEPSQSAISGSILADFVAQQEILAGYLERMDALSVKHLILTSPAAKAVIYSVWYGVEIILAHEARHLKQAEGVLAQLGADPSSIS
ncbi:MAG: DinB family protein [Bacteroidota bacterium]